ncbi:MAG: hypothetical protein U5N26_02120 [Candidatus Marinimicrobia bacterium]|nr:hypothetical protein [Candidatus Neomarinimicrobiota bacterium]
MAPFGAGPFRQRGKRARVPLPGTTFRDLRPGGSGGDRQAVYLNAYDRSYALSAFGASQAVQNVLYVNTPSERIDLIASLPPEALDNGKIVCFLSAEEDAFYTLPVETEGGTSSFPLREKGYYLIAYPAEDTPPDIEVNLNAREILHTRIRFGTFGFFRDPAGTHTA